PGDHHLHHPRRARALQHRVAVVVEAVVGQVGADVDEVHFGRRETGDGRRETGDYPSPMEGFPISPLLPEIRASLAAHPRLVLEAPPGAGKTTQVPLALLDEAWLRGRKLVMLEPRRVAARAAAGFMARQL